MMAQDNKIPFLYTSFLYVCSLVLFLEWLYPVNILADINQLDVFIIYTVFCFAVSLVHLRWWASVPLKLAGIVFIVHLLYADVPFGSKIWFDWIYSELSFNLQAIFAQSWYSLTNLFRTILFLLIIWIMSYLTHYWFYVMKRFFLFILLTFIYVSVMDTFTLYDGKIAIIRVFIVSFMALGIAHFLKELSKESLGFGWLKRAPIWIVPIIMIVVFASIVGFAAPKYAPQWPDPVPFVKGVVNPDGDGDNQDVIRKAGYGEDDSRLGGSFIQDEDVVFYALAPREQYWRIETKDLYTGKGWEKHDEANYVEQKDGQISFSTYSNDVMTEQLTAKVNFEKDAAIDRLVYPYMPISVEEIGDTQLMLNESTEAIHTQKDGKKTSLTSYEITYEYPLYDLDALQSVDGSGQDLNPDHPYMQLPDSLPERVHELAEEITEPYSNRHDKALAVERYFQQNDYVYQTDDVAIPEEDEDYVDQFLFDTQAGYCDNYSTSMVVLLRSVGIPARWSKGFTSGTERASEAQELNGEATNLYEITNANAHSWVEVYFDDIGWVPFEPTKGFSSYTLYAADDDDEVDEDNNDDENVEEEDDTEANDPDMPLPEDDGNSSDTKGNDRSNGWFNATYLIIAIVSIAVIMIIILYLTRHRWRTTMLSRKLRRKEDVASFEAAYQYLLRLLTERGLPKQPDETLRAYAKRVDERFMTTEMRVLTNYYEKVLYNNQHEQKVENELLKTWNNLIKQILS